MTDFVALSIRQFAETWRLMCAGSPTHSFEAADDVEYVFSGFPISFFNIAFPATTAIAGTSGEKLASYGQHACDRAAGKAVPWLFLVTHETLEPETDAAAVLEGSGLIPVLPMTAMYAENLTPAKPLPDGLEIVSPQEETGYSAIVDVNAAAYGMDLEAGKMLIGKRSFWKNHFPVLGLVDGKPVATTSVIMVDGLRYVALVATHPEHQRRGYADAVMRSALAISAQQHGDCPSFLHATDAGRPVYERIGYKPVSTITAFMEKRFLPAEH